MNESCNFRFGNFLLLFLLMEKEKYGTMILNRTDGIEFFRKMPFTKLARLVVEMKQVRKRET